MHLVITSRFIEGFLHSSIFMYISTSVLVAGISIIYENVSVSCKMGMDPFASDKVIPNVVAIGGIVVVLKDFGRLGTVKISIQTNFKEKVCLENVLVLLVLGH